MKVNHLLTIASVIILISAIAIPAGITVRNRHQERLLYATILLIKEAAELCYHQDVCTEPRITLEQLYERNYLEPIAHPITREYYNPASYVLISENNITFNEIN